MKKTFLKKTFSVQGVNLVYSIFGVLILIASYLGGRVLISGDTPKAVMPTLIPTNKPTPTSIPTPVVKGTKTTKTQEVFISDPIVTCDFTNLPDQSMKSSECSKSFECQIDDHWYIYTSREKCTLDQKNYWDSKLDNSYNYPTLAPLPTYTPLPTFTPLPTYEPYASPTLDPAIEEQRLADIQACKDNAKDKYDSELSDLRNIYRAVGALSSSDYGLAVDSLQDEYNYWLYLCENAY